ncbi:MAG: hypothetical protein ACT4PO_12360 [Actinomycetota bacterium]
MPIELKKAAPVVLRSVGLDERWHAEKTEVQSDGRLRKWARIAETGKFLRVILLEDGQTVHNVFFDRSFKESNK